jgi:hypothetical protein
MQIRKRWIVLGVLLCLWLGPAGVASIIALVKLVGTDSKLSPDALGGTPDPVD